MLVASIVIRSESVAPITIPILLEGDIFFSLGAATAHEKDGSGIWCTIFWSNYYWSCQNLGVVIGALHSDLITTEAINL